MTTTQFNLEKIEEISIDYADHKAIEEFANAVDDAIEVHRVKVDTHGLIAVQESKKFITKVKNKVAKYFKSKRDDINKIRTNILDAEKKANEPLKILEEDLKLEIEAEKQRQELELAKAKLPARQALLAQHGLHIDEDVILTLNDIEFQEQVDSMLLEIEREKQREAEKQEAIKQAEIRAKAEAEKKAQEAEERAKQAEIRAKEQEKLLAEQKEKQEKLEAEKLEAEKKAQEIAEKNKILIESAKKEVGYNDKEFKLAQSGNTLAIWKCVKVIKLEN